MTKETPTSLADRILAFDMSAIYGIIAGLVLWMQLTPYLSRLHVSYAGIAIGAVVCGLITNRNGWVAGALMGVLALGMGLHTFFALLAPAQTSAAAEAARHTLIYHTIGLQLLWVPLAALGGFAGTCGDCWGGGNEGGGDILSLGDEVMELRKRSATLSNHVSDDVALWRQLQPPMRLAMLKSVVFGALFVTLIGAEALRVHNPILTAIFFVLIAIACARGAMQHRRQRTEDIRRFREVGLTTLRDDD